MSEPDASAAVEKLAVGHASRLVDLREANERLMVATLRAQELEVQADVARRQLLNFMAVLAHELRNPVAPIRHAIKLLEIEGLSETQKRWSCEVISRQVEHMARLLDDLLDSTRIVRGQLPLQLAVADLGSILIDAVDAARPLLERKQHELEVNLPDEPIMLMVDAVRMAQVLSNLLTNAAKYTDPGGRISVAVGIELDELTITVRDTGIGIRRDAIASLFSMFSQIQSTLDRTEGGLGIGLALASELVKLHGGRIDARSDGDGCGSEFMVRLPLSMVQHDSTTVSTIQPAIERMDASQLVLIADDNVDAATSLGMLLEIAGNDVLIVNDGLDALEVARQRRPHVAILDIGMPRMNGYEVAENLRKDSWGKGVLLIALTGWGQRDDKARALTAGFDHHFTKPVESDELQALISAHAPTSKVDKSSGHEAAPSRRSRRRLGDNQFPVTAMRSADLLEANEQLILAALHAETMATTAEHNLSELTRSSQRDVLTGTPNRALMLDRLESAIAMAQRHAAHVAVLFIDLDNFKQINDTWGHAVGDDVLQRVARHLESVVRASDTVSRHGGDEFLVLLTEVSQRTDAAAIAAKMLVALAEPALPGAQLPSLSASIGISLYPEDGADAASLISCADAAMYRAKQNGNNCFEFYAAHFDFARTQRGRSP